MMQKWRCIALEHLPGLQEAIESATSEVDMWQLLKEILTDSKQEESHSKIFDFAWWSYRFSDDLSLQAAVETYFFENVPYYSDLAPLLPLYLTEEQFNELEDAFRARLSDAEFTELRMDFFRSRE